MALGAAVGEAALGKKLGWKAAAWGAFLGTLPDLDIVANLWLDAVDALASHRGASHSFVMVILLSPLIGWLLARFHRSFELDRVTWTWMVVLVWTTHIFIDLLTVYGTQILWPISDHPFGLDTIFIIDPLYTLPLLGGLIGALASKRESKRRFRWNALGILISSIYLTWGMFAKLFVESAFRQGLASNGIQTEQLITAPTPLNSLMWMGLAQHQDTLYAGIYSILDDRPPHHFQVIPQNTYLLAEHWDDRAVDRLMWFSKGFYGVEEVDSTLVFNDWRFGRSDAWMTENGRAIFSWQLEADSTGEWASFRQRPIGWDDPLVFSRVFDRMWGNR